MNCVRVAWPRQQTQQTNIQTALFGQVTGPAIYDASLDQEPSTTLILSEPSEFFDAVTTIEPSMRKRITV